MGRDVKEMDVGDYVQTLDRKWHKIIGIKFHNRKRAEHHYCVGRHEPIGLIRDWSITTEDGLVLGMMDCNRYAKKEDRQDGFSEVLDRLKQLQEESWRRR